MWGFLSLLLASFALSVSTIDSTGKTSFKSVVASQSGGIRKSVSAAWCLVPVGSLTSTLKSDMHRNQRTSLPVASGRFRIQRSVMWLIRILNREPSRYGLRSSTSRSLAQDSSCVVLLDLLERSWPITNWFSLFFGCCCWKAQKAWRSQALLSRT